MSDGFWYHVKKLTRLLIIFWWLSNPPVLCGQNAGFTIFSMLEAVGWTALLKALCWSAISAWTVLFSVQMSARTHKQTNNHKKTISKDHNKEIMWSDIYSDRFISPIWFTKHVLMTLKWLGVSVEQTESNPMQCHNLPLVIPWYCLLTVENIRKVNMPPSDLPGCGHSVARRRVHVKIRENVG